MNTSNQEKPEMTILKEFNRETNFIPDVLFPQFKFANYKYDDCTIDTYERYVMVSCKTQNAT